MNNRISFSFPRFCGLLSILCSNLWIKKKIMSSNDNDCTNNTVVSGTGDSEQKPQEDIDALLDQVEERFLKSPAAIKLAATDPRDCPCTAKHPTDWKEVDDMLKDFKLEDNNPFSKSKTKSWALEKIASNEAVTTGDTTGVKKEFKKCFAVYLSGSYDQMGYCFLGAEKPCSNLKCLRCDFSVVHFDNYSWHHSTDYLFLRNNMPEFDKLAAKLIRRKGSRAYSCQCQHITTNSLTNVMSRPEVRWICGKHLWTTEPVLKT